ncbi:hypothetical protein HPB51_002069 [Rhipicephalus microplus]|uniref:Uncharacterized protein n=1 Tax=Rhipicephalus microplus TaxID=6941 RepID=A0A9J6E6B6_RHIMP|nr:hypothetical protein HPB51_002069 [Rhipicephalus microplus]
MTKHYNLRDRERDNSEMNGDGAGNLQALGVADSGTGSHGSVTSDTASEQQLALLQLQLKIAEAETEKQRFMLESQRLRARNGAKSNESDDSVALGGSPYVRSEVVQSAVLCAITDKLLDGTDALITPNDYAQLLEEKVKRDIVSYECSAVEETEAMVELSDEACEEQRAMAGVITVESNRFFLGPKRWGGFRACQSRSEVTALASAKTRSQRWQREGHSPGQRLRS